MYVLNARWQFINVSFAALWLKKKNLRLLFYSSSLQSGRGHPRDDFDIENTHWKPTDYVRKAEYYRNILKDLFLFLQPIDMSTDEFCVQTEEKNVKQVLALGSKQTVLLQSLSKKPVKHSKIPLVHRQKVQILILCPIQT